MRQIKFRAWDKTTKSMIIDYVHTGSHSELYVTQFHREAKTPDLILMQFTGLQDKNGKDIYESDKVKYQGDVFIIKWNDIDASFDFFRDIHLDAYNGKIAGQVEIIGNKYETP